MSVRVRLSQTMLLLKKYALYIAFIIALSAMFGSLYFSEILKLPPCLLCWWERILMYPLVLIIAVGIIRKDEKLYQYVLPFSILGMAVAFYHYLLYIKVIPESLSPCTVGVSCVTPQIDWFGFINIPLMSLAAFTIITVIMIVFRRYSNEQNKISNF